MLMAQGLYADVKTEERTRFEFAGVLGGMAKLFGGRAAREGEVTKIALKGNRRMSTTADAAELIDLNEEKIYQIDLKKKTYTVLTFEEMRRQMQEAMAKAKASGPPPAAPSQDNSAKPDQQQPEFTMDFKLEESGRKRTINGYETREVVATVTVREKNKTEKDGAMRLVSSMWLAPQISAMKELDDFNIRYAQKLYLPIAQDMAVQMAPAMAAYPGLAGAMGKLEAERVNLDGTTILTEVRFEAVGEPGQQKQAQPQPQPESDKQTGVPTSLGGLLGGLGRRAVRNDEKSAEKSDERSASIMTMRDELLKVSTVVADSEVAIPAGFKQTK